MCVRCFVLIPILALLCAPTLAGAHELTVLEPGTAKLDLGDASTPRLVHATLVEAADRLELTVRPGALVQVLVLVPDAEPERHSTARPILPIEGVQIIDDRRITDESTGIRYLVVAEHGLDPRVLRAPVGLDIVRGDEPTRVAVLVGDPDASFVTDDPGRTPRTLLALRGWAETPAEGADSASTSDTQTRNPHAAWYGGTIALVAMLLAGWWVRSGRARSRERGIERRDAAD